jgi:hypothetical protein
MFWEKYSGVVPGLLRMIATYAEDKPVMLSLNKVETNSW